MGAWSRSPLRGRQAGTAVFLGQVLAVSLLSRVALLLQTAGSADWSPAALVGSFAVGAGYDLVTASYLALPCAIYFALLPAGVFGRRWHRGLVHAAFFAATFLLLFSVAVEWVFWSEFGARLNFIAVDYLIYTREVLGTIGESWPVGWLLAAFLLVTAAVHALVFRGAWASTWFASQTPPGRRLRTLAVLLPLPLLAGLIVRDDAVPEFANHFNQELARNGLHSFAAALRENRLDYERFYPTIETRRAFQRARRLLQAGNSRWVSDDPLDLRRWIDSPEPERHYNVIQITVESLSSSFMGAFGNPDGLTPNLDRLAREGLLFTNFRATGTRTVRGMEALTLSIPPTPGLSIVRRPHNEDLFTLGSVLRTRGYDTAFLYGGYGYFDNMNYFFAHNGYRVVDRAALPAAATTFATVWGACDEDLLRWSLDDADRSWAAGKPFFQFVMTTSNHRPYAYPAGRIDLPPGTRAGAVKYTDFAIGQFMRQAARRPWFGNTLFVLVADHCASSAGKADLPVKKYEIPLIVYNPGLISPRRVDRLCSQIDYAPTLLGLMHWDYESRFYGRDVLASEVGAERAFVASYQVLGYMGRDRLVVLKPLRRQRFYRYDRASGELGTAPADGDVMLADAVAYYQTASYLFAHGLYRERGM